MLARCCGLHMFDHRVWEPEEYGHGIWIAEGDERKELPS